MIHISLRRSPQSKNLLTCGPSHFLRFSSSFHRRSSLAMRSFLFAALVGLVAAQSNSTTSGTSLSSVASRVSSTLSPSATISSASSAITVALDGSGQYTAINAAVSAAQNSGVPTVTVLPGKRNLLLLLKWKLKISRHLLGGSHCRWYCHSHHSRSYCYRCCRLVPEPSRHRQHCCSAHHWFQQC